MHLYFNKETIHLLLRHFDNDFYALWIFSYFVLYLKLCFSE